MTRGQRLVVIGLGGVAAAVAAVLVARRVGLPEEAIVPGGLIGLAVGAFAAIRILAVIDSGHQLADDVQTLRDVLREEPAAPRAAAPPPLSATKEGLAEWLAGRDDLRLFAADEVAALPDALEAGERVVGIGLGTREGTAGLLSVTDRRLLFLRKGGGTDEIKLPDVLSVVVQGGTIMSTLTVEHRGGEAAFEVPAEGVGSIAGALGRPVRTVSPEPLPAEEPPTAPEEGATPPVAP